MQYPIANKHETFNALKNIGYVNNVDYFMKYKIHSKLHTCAMLYTFVLSNNHIKKIDIIFQFNMYL